MPGVDVILPYVSAVAGGLSVMLITWMKGKSDRNKELMALAVQSGIEAFKADRVTHGDSELKNRPMSFYIYFHYNFLHLVENGRATPEEIKKININQEKILQTVNDGPWGKALSKQVSGPEVSLGNKVKQEHNNIN